MTAGYTKIEPGYWEFRANWSDVDLMQMTGEQLECLRKLMDSFGELASAVGEEHEA